MFKKILIANRGEIACRVAATARRMAVRTVAVYSDADAGAKHVHACDEAVHIGGSAPSDSYLRWERIVAAAQATGAQAIHPGYGFLSENDEFAQACADAGLVFIGPPPDAIRAMGLKAESKRLMEKAGVPLVPGYHGADQGPALLHREADRIGYPVLIKASAGGGGRGMRIVEATQDFEAALGSCKREATNSFGDDAVLIEKYVQRPRHIEIQVFADTQGDCVWLFERDCSVQRRHQKVLEEAPAPGITQAMRKQMGEAAVAAAKAVNYVGAGTVEFIVEQVHARPARAGAPRPSRGDAPRHSRAGGNPAHSNAQALDPRLRVDDDKGNGDHDGLRGDDEVTMNFFFMEMNTRLQVEHPVTEAITGLDLVEWQLRVASGEPLPLKQNELKIHGHAIEARICAENPDNNFLPATGTLRVYRKPHCTAFERAKESDSSVGVRIDDGVREGDTISPDYDSMIAKLIVHAETREQAMARLDEALAQTHIVGLATNVQFLRRVVKSASFAQANLDTGLIEREKAVLFHQEPVGLAQAAAAAVAQTLLDEQSLQGNDPFSRRDGWRSHGIATRRFSFEFGGVSQEAELVYLHDGALVLTVGGSSGPLSFARSGAGIDLRYAGQRQTVMVYSAGELDHVFTARGATQIFATDLLAHAGEGVVEGGRLTAPMPGKLVSFSAKAGDKVSKGQALAVMEAMKMEHTIVAPRDGVVAELLYAPGDQVAEGEELLKLTA
jgi:3-methylcrotonyl-CoA carboxylase alpha subunit